MAGRNRSVWASGSHLTCCGTLPSLGRLPVVVLEQASQTLPGGYRPRLAKFLSGKEESVPHALVIPFSVIMDQEFGDNSLEGLLPDHDETRSVVIAVAPA